MLTTLYPYYNNTRSNVVMRLTNSKTNAAGIGAPVAADPSPVTVDDYMLFNGVDQVIRYPDRSEWHPGSQYSVELEFYAEDDVQGHLAACGQGFGIGWPEWMIHLTGGGIRYASSSTNTGETSVGFFANSFSQYQWYRIGLMFDTNRAYGFFNDKLAFNVAWTIPYNSTNGISVGADYVPYSTSFFKGRIRNLTIARSLLWGA